MPRAITKESEKARTHLSDALFRNEAIVKQMTKLIQDVALKMPEAEGDLFNAAIAIRDAIQVRICQEREAEQEELRLRANALRELLRKE